MQQLIKIKKQEIGTEFTNSINSRELYEFLNISTAYSHWIQRAIQKYDFLENIDFVKIDKPINNQKDYIVTLDMAKELCMVSNTEKGKEVRRYFISCEKELLNQKSSNNDLQKIINQLETQNQEIQNLKNQLALQEPQKPINPFKGFYQNKNRDLGQRENEFAYSRYDWMMLLNECETQLGIERGRKTKTLLISGGGR